MGRMTNLQPMKTSTRPNFILFITDQQRADHLGAYGNRVVPTPNLDRLADRGWLAERCHVASPICMPNRASLMTGRMPSAHGARHNGIPLSLQARTFVERLRESGYQTALIGKSHLQNITCAPPQYPDGRHTRFDGEARHDGGGRYDQECGPLWDQQPDFEVDLPFYGFEFLRLVINHGDTAGGHYRRWLQAHWPEIAALTGPDHAIPTPDFELSKCHQAWRTRVPEELSTTAYVAAQACERLEHYAVDRRPFFMMCSFPDPHHPFTPPGRYWDMFEPAAMNVPTSFHAQHTGTTPHLDWLHRQRDLGKAVKNSPALFAATEREVQEALALNYGSIAHIDSAVGQVVASLHRSGLSDDTVVIFTSDHGDYFGDHQLLWKGPLHFQGLTRVPLIWSDPDRQAQALSTQRSHHLCSTLDIAPTILARAGCLPYHGIQGMNLLPLMQGQDWNRDALLIEEEGQRVMFGFSGRTRMRTLQTERWRLSVYEGVDWGELYDLQQDPHECCNLWEAPGSKDVKLTLLHELTRQMIHYADPSPSPSALA